jgi:hypothetical protein
MTEGTISLIISIVALLIAFFCLWGTRKNESTTSRNDFNTIPLQLQAYERLVLFCERTALPNLVGRMNHPQLSSRELQMLLVENIKQEYEYNISQQVYVSSVAWNAVQNLKDQTLLMINQVANVLPPDAKGSDLSKQLIEVIMSQQEKALHTIVLEALNFEARKLLG